MEFFTYNMPPFLNVMGAFYILVAAPIIINFLRSGYWRGVFSALAGVCRRFGGLIAATIIVVLAMITWLDLPVTVFLKNIDPTIHAYKFFDFICSCGEGGFVAGLIFTLMMLATYYKKNYLAEVARISFMSSVFGGLVNAIFKFVFNRQRPSIGLDQWHFFAFFKSGGQVSDLWYAFNSMPSGHTISVVAAVVPFFIAYKNKAVRSFCVFYALAVGFARIYTINHWLSDVTIATLFGFLIGLAVYQANSWRLSRAQ